MNPRDEGRPWQVREMGPESAPALCALFEEVFGQPMSTAHWQWKYGTGYGQGIGVWAGERLIAHYGGVTRALLDAGVPCLGVQGADAAVTPRERGRLTRHGPYFLAASTFHDQFIGSGTRHLYGFGFPSERHYRLAHTLGFYEAVDKIVEFSFPPLSPGWRRATAAIDTRALIGDETLRADLARAWERMRRDLQPFLLGVRDLDYLRHRYAGHPERSYQFLAVRHLGIGPRHAFAVVRNVPGQGLEWLDVIGSLRAIPSLAVAVRRHAGLTGAQRVFGWITASQQQHFALADAHIQPTGIIVPANRRSAHPPPATQQGRWWLMAGDTDFH